MTDEIHELFFIIGPSAELAIPTFDFIDISRSLITCFALLDISPIAA
jgi:hypothetical protein